MAAKQKPHSSGKGANKQRKRPAGGALQPLQALDERLSNALYRAGTSVPRVVWRAFESSGDGLIWLAAIIGFAASPATTSADRNAWLNLLAAWGVDLALVGGLKAAARRPRPVYNQAAGDFTVVVAVDHFSFPSGHSSRASFVALFAAVLLSAAQPWLCAGVAAWAVALALSRAAMGRHYLSDVLAGLLLGAVTVGIVTQGTYSAAGLAVSQRQSEAAYALFRKLLNYAADGLQGALAA